MVKKDYSFDWLQRKDEFEFLLYLCFAGNVADMSA